MERRYFVELTENGKSVDYLCAIKHDARATTLQYIHGATDEEIDWQPHEGWNSVGALLHHIISIDHFFRIRFIEQRNFSLEEKIKWLPGLELGKHLPKLKGRKADDLILELGEAHEMMIKAIRGLSENRLFMRIPKVYNEITGCDLAWVIYHSAEDEVHHRGQISFIRKLFKTVNNPVSVEANK